MVKRYLRQFSIVLLGLVIIASAIHFVISLLPHSERPPFASQSMQPLTLRLWHYYNGSTKEAFDRQIKLFNATEGEHLGIIVQPFTMGEVSRLAQAVNDAAAQNIPPPSQADEFAVYRVESSPLPDIFATYTQSLLDIPFALVELSSQLPSEKLAQFRPNVLTDGYLCPPNQLEPICGLYVMPTSKSTEVLYINKTMWDTFSASGNTDLDSLSTWEGLKDAAKHYYHWTDSLTPEPNDGKAMFRFDSAASFVSTLYAQQVGQDALAVATLPAAVADALNQYGIALPKVMARPYPADVNKTLARLIWELYHKPFVSGYYGMKGRFSSDDIKTGNVIAYIGSSAGGLYFPSTVEVEPGQSVYINGTVLPLPTLAGHKPAAIRQGAGFSIVAGDVRRENAAMAFLSWLTEPEHNIVFALDTGYLPVTVTNLDAETKQRFAQIPSAPAQLAEYTRSDDYADAQNTCTVAGLAALVAMEMADQDLLLADTHVNNAQYIMAFWDSFLQEKVDIALRDLHAVMAKGMPYTEAVKMILSEKCFEQWYLDMRSGMAKVLAPSQAQPMEP